MDKKVVEAVNLTIEIMMASKKRLSKELVKDTITKTVSMLVKINSRRVSKTSITIHLVSITSKEEGTIIQEVEAEV